MLSSIITPIILSAFLGLAAWLVFMWAVKKWQMDDIEGTKYRMLVDEPQSVEKTPDGSGDDV